MRGILALLLIVSNNNRSPRLVNAMAAEGDSDETLSQLHK